MTVAQLDPLPLRTHHLLSDTSSNMTETESESNMDDLYEIIEAESWKTDSEPRDDTISSVGIPTPQRSPSLVAQEDLADMSADEDEEIVTQCNHQLDNHQPIIEPFSVEASTQSSVSDDSQTHDEDHGTSAEQPTMMEMPHLSQSASQRQDSCASTIMPTGLIQAPQLPTPFRIAYHGTDGRREQILAKIAEMVVACSQSQPVQDSTVTISTSTRYNIVQVGGSGPSAHPRVSLVPTSDLDMSVSECTIHHPRFHHDALAPKPFDIEFRRHFAEAFSEKESSLHELPHLAVIISDIEHAARCSAYADYCGVPVLLLITEESYEVDRRARMSLGLPSCSLTIDRDFLAFGSPTSKKCFIGIDYFLKSDPQHVGRFFARACHEQLHAADIISKPLQSQMMHSTILKAWHDLSEPTLSKATDTTAYCSRMMKQSVKAVAAKVDDALQYLAISFCDEAFRQDFVADIRNCLFCLLCFSFVASVVISVKDSTDARRIGPVDKSFLASALSSDTTGIPQILVTRLTASPTDKLPLTASTAATRVRTQALATVISNGVTSRLAESVKALGQYLGPEEKKSVASCSSAESVLSLPAIGDMIGFESTVLENVVLKPIEGRDCVTLIVPRSNLWQESHIVVQATSKGRDIPATVTKLRPETYMIQAFPDIWSGAVQITLFTRTIPLATLETTVHASSAYRLLAPLGGRLGLLDQHWELSKIINSTLIDTIVDISHQPPVNLMDSVGLHIVHALSRLNVLFTRQSNDAAFAIKHSDTAALNDPDHGASGILQKMFSRPMTNIATLYVSAHNTTKVQSIRNMASQIYHLRLTYPSLSSHNESIHFSPSSVKAPLTKTRQRLLAIGRSLGNATFNELVPDLRAHMPSLGPSLPRWVTQRFHKTSAGTNVSNKKLHNAFARLLEASKGARAHTRQALARHARSAASHAGSLGGKIRSRASTVLARIQSTKPLGSSWFLGGPGHDDSRGRGGASADDVGPSAPAAGKKHATCRSKRCQQRQRQRAARPVAP